MNITFNVDQKTAFTRGINAPSSTVKIDVDPAKLTPRHREILGSVLRDGHDATGPGLLDISSDLSEKTSSWKRLYLVRSTFEGVVEALQVEEDGLAADRKEKLAEKKEDKKKILAAVEEHSQKLMNQDPSVFQELELFMSHEGEALQRFSSGVFVGLKYQVPRFFFLYYGYGQCPESEELNEKIKIVRDSATVDAAVVLEGMRQEKLKEEAKDREEYKRLYERLPGTLQERHENSFASQKEVLVAIKVLILHDSGFADMHHAPFEDCDYNDVTDLSDQEFSALKVIQKRAPEDAEVGPVDVFFYREATSEDDAGDIDDDNEVRVYKRCIRVAWKRAGIPVVATIPLNS